MLLLVPSFTSVNLLQLPVVTMSLSPRMTWVSSVLAYGCNQYQHLKTAKPVCHAQVPNSHFKAITTILKLLFSAQLAVAMRDSALLEVTYTSASVQIWCTAVETLHTKTTDKG